MEQGLKQFIENLSSSLESVDASSLKADLPVKEMGLDSLEMLNLVMMIKMKYNKTLDGITIKNSATVEDLYAKVLQA